MKKNKTADKIVIFPIRITKNDEETEFPYLVYIPDLDGMTEAKSVADAFDMAKDYIGTYSLENKLPKSNAKLPKANKGDIVTLVNVDISKYKRRHDKKVVRKTLTIPNYLNEEAKEAHINFSALLSDAIRNKLGIN